MKEDVQIIKGERKVNAEIGIIDTVSFVATINWSIHVYKHKFLWWRWKSYEYYLSVPYIQKSECMMSVSEINTNTRLKMAATEERFKINEKIRELKENE